MRKAILAANGAVLCGLVVVGVSQLLPLVPALLAWQFGCHF
ncbi:hypothetical protein ACXVSK_11360 [Pseudomonas aeruginosa]|nr:hypothetical protein [Pseudomonas aeruginosa]WBI55329.1 hypothetical protein PALA30_02052 [Pseudomonas aeruginosa]WJM44085.1 hypothetical protein QUC24_09970 [Pseudomonas aeruginosa]